MSTRFLFALARIVVITSVVLVAYVMLFEHRLIYYPTGDVNGSPSSPHEDVYFASRDGTRLHGWFVPAGGERALIVSHGNGGNIGHRREMADFLSRELRIDVFAYDYRGYGNSEGSPSEEGTYSDIRGAYDYVRSRGHVPETIYLMGQSLGAAVTVDLASEERVGGLILEAPFTSIAGVARRIFGLPIGWILRTRYDSTGKIGRIHVPIAIIHARNDPVLPFDLGVELFDSAKEPKRFFEVDGEVHEGAIMGLGLEKLDKLKEFLFR